MEVDVEEDGQTPDQSGEQAAAVREPARDATDAAAEAVVEVEVAGQTPADALGGQSERPGTELVLTADADLPQPGTALVSPSQSEEKLAETPAESPDEKPAGQLSAEPILVVVPQSIDAAGVVEAGKAYMLQGDYDAALERYEHALTLFEQSGDRAGVAGGLFELGVLSILQARYDEADGYYRQALSLWRELGNPAGQVDALEQLGLLHLLRGEEDRSRACYRQAQQVLA